MVIKLSKKKVCHIACRRMQTGKHIISAASNKFPGIYFGSFQVAPPAQILQYCYFRENQDRAILCERILEEFRSRAQAQALHVSSNGIYNKESSLQ